MPVPERGLRQMVVDLATLHPDDVAAVLGQLEAKQRTKVEALLQELSDFGFGKRITSPREGTDGIDTTRISPWLVQRLEPNKSDARMSVEARTALRNCALRVCPVARDVETSTQGYAFTLFRRLKSLVGAGEAA